MKLFPISGYDYGIYSIKFLVLPVVIGVCSIGVGVGSGRYSSKEPAGLHTHGRAKGLSGTVLFSTP